jgi:hypothetical protein
MRAGCGATQSATAAAPSAPLRASLQAAATEVVVPTLEVPKYCEAVYQTRRRPTRTVTVGGVSAGHGQRRVPLPPAAAAALCHRR